MDILSDVLSVIEMRGSIYFRSEFGSPWGIRFPETRGGAHFHIMSRGTCIVRMDGHGEPVRLSAGDMLVLVRGGAHQMSCLPDAHCRPVEEVIAEAGFDGSGVLVYGGNDDPDNPSCLISGSLALGDHLARLLGQSLPSHILVRQPALGADGWFADIVRLITLEAAADRPGSHAVVNRLAEILLVHAIRAHAETAAAPEGLIVALRDARLTRALRGVHDHPGHGWTVAALAAKAGMSRTAFSERMTALLGMSPMAYVTQWRMTLASRDLKRGEAVSAVAEKSGYGSIPAFSRVFKKHFGAGPGAFRKAAIQPPAAEPPFRAQSKIG